MPRMIVQTTGSIVPIYSKGRPFFFGSCPFCADNKRCTNKSVSDNLNHQGDHADIRKLLDVRDGILQHLADAKENHKEPDHTRVRFNMEYLIAERLCASHQPHLQIAVELAMESSYAHSGFRWYPSETCGSNDHKTTWDDGDPMEID